MQDDSRLRISVEYRQKSDESMEAARSCFLAGHLPSTCNRSWYATMQIITAAGYSFLNDNPPKDKINWNHDRMPDLFRDLVKKAKSYEKWRHLPQGIELLLQLREQADYGFFVEPVSTEIGERAVSIAGQVREALLPLLERGNE